MGRGRKAVACGVYKITCNANGKVYIGKSVNIFTRWKTHFNNLVFGNHPNVDLQQDFNKYGFSSFTFEILALSKDISASCSLEYRLIREHKSQVKGKGYNLDIRLKTQGRAGADPAQ